MTFKAEISVQPLVVEQSIQKPCRTTEAIRRGGCLEFHDLLWSPILLNHAWSLGRNHICHQEEAIEKESER